MRINNPADAIRICSDAAAKFPDNLRLRHNLGRAYAQNGARDLAFAKFSEAAKAGYAASMLALAEHLLAENDEAQRVEGRSWLRKAREFWYPAANYALAEELERGRGGPIDLAGAREEYAIAANNGFIDGFIELGRMYGLGLGGPKDEVKARDHYRTAASRGSPVAKNNLGHMLWRGEGGAADPQEARRLMEQSAATGYGPALNNLGIMIWTGVGGNKDPAEALKVFQVASPRHPLAWANIALLHLSGDLGDQNVDSAIQAYANAAKAGVGLDRAISSWLDSGDRKQETRFACMLIALTLADDKSGSQLFERISLRNDPFQADVSKVLGMIKAPELEKEIQQHSWLSKLRESAK